MHQLSKEQARQIAVHAQLLAADRPTNLLELVQHLTLVQCDQTAAVAPSADIVAWSRLGSGYAPHELVGELESRTLIELGGMIRPSEDIALFRAEMAAWPGSGPLREWDEMRRDWVRANDACRRDILERLEASGPMSSRDFPDTCEVAWSSSGWTNNQNVRKLLDFMVARGEVAVSARQGRDPLWDLASRVYPDDPVVPEGEALRTRAELRLHALGIARARSVAVPGEPNDVSEAGEEASVEGVKGTWRVDPAYLDLPFEGRTVLLSPLDRLVFDRKRMEELFEFDYQLEMYKPVAKRRWGYWAMPILNGDRLIGKLDATADRKTGVLRVDAVHQDVAFDKELAEAVDGEIDDLAGWLDLERVDAGG